MAPPPMAPRHGAAGGGAGRGAGLVGAPDQRLGAGRVLGRRALGQRRARPEPARPHARASTTPCSSAWRWPLAWRRPARCSNWTPTRARAQGTRVALRVLGIDALSIAAMAPRLLPRPAAGRRRLCHARPAARVPQPARARAAGREGRRAAGAARRPALAVAGCGRRRARHRRGAGGDGHRRRAGAFRHGASADAHRPAAAARPGRAADGWPCRRCRPA